MGGWTGLADEDVCARLATNTHAADWTVAGRPSEACTAMLGRAFHAFCIPAHTLLYALCMWLCVKWLLERARVNMLARRVALEIRALQQPNVPMQRLADAARPTNLMSMCSQAHSCQARTLCTQSVMAHQHGLP